MDSENNTSGSNLVLGIIVWLSQKLFEFSVVISVVTLFMTYVLRMGEWTFNGMQISYISSTFLKTSVYLGIAYNAVFKPIAGIVEIPKKCSIMYILLGIDNSDAYARSYYERLMKSLTFGLIASNIVSCILALALRIPIMSMWGDTVASIVALLIAFGIPKILTPIIISFPVGKLTKESPELYAAWDELVSSGVWEAALLKSAGAMF